jgi:hypothetical protein
LLERFLVQQRLLLHCGGLLQFEQCSHQGFQSLGLTIVMQLNIQKKFRPLVSC